MLQTDQRQRVVDELTSRVKASGKPIVFWEETHHICAGMVVVRSQRTNRILAKSVLGSFRILRDYCDEVPRVITFDEASHILKLLPQLVTDFETYAPISSEISPRFARVDQFCAFAQDGEHVKVIVNGTDFWCESSKLKAVPLVMTMGIEQDDNKEQETDTSFQPLVSQTVLECLNHHPFVWWKSESGWNVCGHVVERDDSLAIVRTMLGTYLQIDTAHLREGTLPEDLNAEQVKLFVQSLPTLLPDFQTGVRVQCSYLFSSWEEIHIVEKFSFGHEQTFNVQTNKKPHNLSVTVDDLTDVPAGGAANDKAKEMANLTTALQTAQSQLEEMKVELANEQAEKNSISEQLNAASRQLAASKKDLIHAQGETHSLASDLRREKALVSTKTATIERLRRSISSKESALSRKETELQRERSESARRSSELRRKTSEISDLNGQVKRLERNVSAREQTIAEYGNRFSEMTREQGELRLEVTNKNSEIKRLNKNIDAYEGVEEELTEVRKKNKELHREKDVLRTELSKYKGSIALDNPINSINLVSKMENLRDQEHAFACDVLIEEMGWDVKDAYRLLFEVFMLSYEYFENRMNDIRTLLNMNEDSALSALFSGPLQFNYAKLMDKKGLEERFVTAFEKVLGDNVEHRDMKKYVVACGELCWVAVLRTVPAKMYFFPRIDEINEDELQLFDPSRFMDYDQLSGERFVVQYILPGVSRVDSDRPLGLPLVLTEGREEKSDSNEEEAGLPVDEMRSELAPIEDAMWLSKRRKTRKLFGQMKIKPENCDLVIGCAADGCDFIHASSFAEFLLAIDKHRLCCGEDEDHVGVKILRLVPHDEY